VCERERWEEEEEEQYMTNDDIKKIYIQCEYV